MLIKILLEQWVSSLPCIIDSGFRVLAVAKLFEVEPSGRAKADLVYPSSTSSARKQYFLQNAMICAFDR